MILLIDNFDSFTYNLVQLVSNLGEDVKVLRNDCTLDEVIDISPKKIIISPGPGKPENAKTSISAIRHFYKKVPILGVCLGHQAIVEIFGGKVTRAKKIVHGKVYKINHNNKGLFYNAKEPLSVARYHSLAADYKTLPDCLNLDAYANEENGERTIMAISHKKYPLFGVQFHPESIATEDGNLLLQNFLKIS